MSKVYMAGVLIGEAHRAPDGVWHGETLTGSIIRAGSQDAVIHHLKLTAGDAARCLLAYLAVRPKP